MNLADLLRSVPRRYRLPEQPGQGSDTSARLGWLIEQARSSVQNDTALAPALKDDFTDALARLVCEAMQPESGDPAFQAMVLRHHVPEVREYASLAAQVRRNRRQAGTPDKLLRLRELQADARVQRYEALWSRHGPRAGSAAARLAGEAAQRRGAAMEARATQAVRALADRLAELSNGASAYRVVTSLLVPASITAPRSRAKSEWDVALLRASADWDICLLVEAKASVDAATTDFPRLLRGLRLLGSASEGVDHTFTTAEGPLRLSGASLHAFAEAAADLASTVLYCVDAPAGPTHRVLSAASRMQLLSATACLNHAAALAQGERPPAQHLQTVWNALLTSPAWRPVLNQYATQRRVRELMVHVDDLLATLAGP